MNDPKDHSSFAKKLDQLSQELSRDDGMNISDFVDEVANLFQSSAPSFKNENNIDLDNLHILPNQAIYCIDYSTSEVAYHRNVTNLLGYNEDELSHELFTTLYHPDQAELLDRIVKGAIHFGLTQSNTSKENSDTWMYISYKARKKDGSYIPVLRQTSILQKTDFGGMIKSYSILTDLSGISEANKVEWRITGPSIDEERFRKEIQKAYTDLFTKREMEVLHELCKGLNSKEISERLYMSRHTVDTHRRNMLRKSSCSNTTELIHFALKHGMI